MELEDLRDKALQQHTSRQDKIRLERFIKENKTAAEWKDNWAFLLETYDDEKCANPKP